MNALTTTNTGFSLIQVHLFSSACSLQSCLNKNLYSPEKCDRYLGRLYECCQKMYDSGHENSGSTACPMPKVVRKWLLEDHPVAEAVRMQRR